MTLSHNRSLTMTMQRRVPGQHLYRIERRGARFTPAERAALDNPEIDPLDDVDLERLLDGLRADAAGRHRRD